MANERHTDVRGWEIDSSTRQSVHPYTKYTPFRTATSTTAVFLRSNIKSYRRSLTRKRVLICINRLIFLLSNISG